MKFPKIKSEKILLTIFLFSFGLKFSIFKVELTQITKRGVMIRARVLFVF